MADPWLDDLKVDYDEDQRWIVMHRGSLAIACNLNAERGHDSHRPASPCWPGASRRRRHVHPAGRAFFRDSANSQPLVHRLVARIVPAGADTWEDLILRGEVIPAESTSGLRDEEPVDYGFDARPNCSGYGLTNADARV